MSPESSVMFVKHTGLSFRFTRSLRRNSLVSEKRM